jgi:hypothetical protein
LVAVIRVREVLCRNLGQQLENGVTLWVCFWWEALNASEVEIVDYH